MITFPSKQEMGNSNDAPDQRSGEESATRGRLDSWKEIAAYFQRSVRCVQRWEKTEGLPVFRHKHAAGATVYAYGDLLDAWFHEGRGVARNFELAEGKGGPSLRASNHPPRQTRLEPAVHGAFALLLQRILRPFGR